MNNGTKRLALCVAAALVVIDQVLKRWAVGALAAPIQVIPGLFSLTYVENRGAAFGILQNSTRALTVVSSVVLVAVLVLLLSNRVKEKFLIWSIALVLAGGVGNCIDRALRGFVVDYLDFSALFGFPVFNFADCCVVVGTALILIYLLIIEPRQLKQEQAASGEEEEPPTPSEEPQGNEEV